MIIDEEATLAHEVLLVSLPCDHPFILSQSHEQVLKEDFTRVSSRLDNVSLAACPGREANPALWRVFVLVDTFLHYWYLLLFSLFYLPGILIFLPIRRHFALWHRTRAINRGLTVPM